MKSFQQRDDKKSKSDRKLFRCSDLNYLIGESLKPPRNKDQKAFVGGGWSDSENIGEDKINDETCLMAQSSNEVTLDSSHYSDNSSSFNDDRQTVMYCLDCDKPRLELGMYQKRSFDSSIVMDLYSPFRIKALKMRRLT
ncbi:hypothetical protein Tco_0390611 [Tanacetum coccineum]